MTNVLDAIIFYDDLTPEQQASFHAALEANPQLADPFRKWRALQLEVRSSLAEKIPDRDVLVLYALAQHSPEALTVSEKNRIASSEPVIENALREHPALQDVIREIQSARADFESLWQNALSRQEEVTEDIPLKVQAPDRHPVTRVTGRNRVYRLASVFVLVAVMVTAGLLTWRTQNFEIVKTSPGELRVVELTDGSTVRLFEKSRIMYSKQVDQFVNKRSVELKGRAFFDVAPGGSPFQVETPTALTEARGTKFSIEASRSLTKVILTSGQVAVASRQRRQHDVILSPGEMSQIRRRKQPSEPLAIGDLTDTLSWTGLLVFHDTPLEEVALHLSNHYNVQVSIAPELLDEQWVASYDPDTLSVDEILDNLAVTLGAVLEKSDDNAYLLSR